MPISQLRVTRKRINLAEFIPPLAMVDPKWKVPETPFSKPHKKRKKTKISVVGELKKAKLLASTTFVVRMA